MNTKHSDQKNKSIMTTVWIMLAIVAFVVFSLWYKLQQPIIISDGALKAYGVYVFEQPRLTKPFSLLDQDGQAFSKKNLQDKWSLVFFGFTQCPDICPTTLSFFKQLKTNLSETEVANSTQFMMVSVDPARDTPAVLKEYINHFDKEFIALTGEFLAVHNFALNMNAAFRKVITDTDYTIDHTGNIVMLNEYGDYQGFFKPPFDVHKIKQAYRSIRYQHRR